MKWEDLDKPKTTMLERLDFLFYFVEWAFDENGGASEKSKTWVEAKQSYECLKSFIKLNDKS